MSLVSCYIPRSQNIYMFMDIDGMYVLQRSDILMQIGAVSFMFENPQDLRVSRKISIAHLLPFACLGRKVPSKNS